MVLVFSKPFQSVVLHANMYLKTKFSKDLHSGLILDSFWDENSIEIRFKINAKIILDAKSFSTSFSVKLG